MAGSRRFPLISAQRPLARSPTGTVTPPRTQHLCEGVRFTVDGVSSLGVVGVVGCVLGCVPSESGTLQLPAAGTGTLHLPSGSVPHLGAARASVTGVCAAGQAQAARLEPGGASAACPGQLGRRLVPGSSCPGPDGRTVALARAAPTGPGPGTLVPATVPLAVALCTVRVGSTLGPDSESHGPGFW